MTREERIFKSNIARDKRKRTRQIIEERYSRHFNKMRKIRKKQSRKNICN